MSSVHILVILMLLLLVTLLVVDVYLISKHYDRHAAAAAHKKTEKDAPEVNVTLPSSDSNSNSTMRRPRIAYIFAGALRTFTCPRVHWTIKTHLIDALGGDPYVFIRLSYEDNKNVKTGDGIIMKPGYNELEINEALRLLNPVVVESYLLSTQIEEMKRHHPQPIHTVFRENDNRRYSMFYHRCRAYKLMLKYEVEHNIKFDWVMLVRLDAAWISSLLPIEAYANDRVWMTETGYSYFNDQFMMIPRQFSDYLYDLNTKVTQEVYCLGGPDVERWKCNRTALLMRGVSEEKIASVLPYCCADIFMQKNSDGWSEKIHYRHMRAAKIPASLGRFPVALTRDTTACEVECFRMYGYMFKEFNFLYEKVYYPYMMPAVWPDTKGRSISSRDRQLCYAWKESVYPWKPINAIALHKLAATNSSYSLDYSKRLVDQSDKVHPSIFLNPKDTEFWRIHPTWNVDGCLRLLFDTKQLVWDSCLGHVQILGRMLTYAYAQLFLLYVVPQKRPADSVIQSHSYQRSSWFPETTYSSTVPNITRLMALNTGGKMQFRHRVDEMLCLTAGALEEHAPINMTFCSKDMSNKLQNLLTVRTQMDGSHPHSTIGQLAFAEAPHLCVTRDDNKQTKDHFGNQIIFPNSNALFVYKCDWQTFLHQNMFEFELTFS